MRASSLVVLLLCGCLPDAPAHTPDDLAMPAPDLAVGDMAMPPPDLAVAIDLRVRLRRVFLTSTLYTADLGGLPGADAKCQASADAAGLGGGWIAWLADSAGAPVTRFATDGVFALVSGNPVANSWEQLTSGSLRHAIDVDEWGGRVDDAGSAVKVWTDTTVDGRLKLLAADCGDWTDPFSSTSLVGSSSAQSASWTEANYDGCNISAALYCFEK